MPADTPCDQVMAEISIGHDEARAPSKWASDHMRTCPECAAFAARLVDLDGLMARGDFSQAPDMTATVMDNVKRPRRQWWSVAAVALVGLVVGAMVGGVGTGLDIGEASDLGELFHTAGTDLEGVSADVVVVERGIHPSIDERVYTGTIDYVAPEQLSIQLVDSTEYPDQGWIPNDVSLTISDGDMVISAGSTCPVAAQPGCLVEPTTRAVVDQRPFDDGVLLPLEIVGPGRSLTSPSAIEVLGTTELDDNPAIQVRSTVAAVELIEAVTANGAWRDLHPTDAVLMWLDAETLVPLRIEVFAVDSPERELWQLRHDYTDDLTSTEPIFIIELADLVTEPGQVDIEIPDEAPTRGFVDGSADVPQPDLPHGFGPHRSGSWVLADGTHVELSSWSDGRSWLRVEAVDAWNEPRLFGLNLPFVDPIDLGEGSLGYMSPNGDAVAIHTESGEFLISGSVPRETLVEAASSLGVTGLGVPFTWREAATVNISDLPEGTLVPAAEGWSVLGRIDDGTTTLLLHGGGSRSVLVTQQPGTRLDPPTGPDYSEVRVRGIDARFNASEATLEWVEDNQVVRMRSETVGLTDLADLAETMSSR